MDDCAALIGEAARAAGTRQFSFRGKTADPFAEPERLSVAAAFERHAGVDVLATVSAGQGDQSRLGGRSREGGRRHRRGRYLGRYFQPHPGRAGRAASRTSDARHFSMNIRCRWRRWRGQNPAATRWPNGSSSMPAGLNSPTASANSPMRPSSARALRRRWRRSSASTASVIRSTRNFCRACCHAAGVRHCARFRPAGDAGDRAAAHRAGDMDAGGRAMNRMKEEDAMTTLPHPGATLRCRLRLRQTRRGAT